MFKIGYNSTPMCDIDNIRMKGGSGHRMDVFRCPKCGKLITGWVMNTPKDRYWLPMEEYFGNNTEKVFREEI